MLSKERIEKAIELGFTLEKTANFLDCHVQTLRKYMKMYGLYSKYIPKSNAVRRVSLDERYFHEIDTESKAYFLGLLFSDGWVTNKTVGIRLIDSDSEVIHAMKKDMQSGHKIQIKDGKGLRKDQVGLEVCSVEMVRSLKKYGLHSNKSHTLEINFNNIPSEYHKDVLRGVFDGDGSFSNNQPCIATSSEFFKNQLVKKCFEYTGTKPHVSCQKETNYRVYFRKRDFPFVANMYLNSNIGISRKNESFKKLYSLWK